jgi:hypothetical protein
MLILLLTGFLSVAGGVTGLYVGKIFEQVKGRPLYVVDLEIRDGVERGVARELASYGEPSRVVADRSWSDRQASGS